jgi:two-component system LytT family response regulator
MTALRVLIVDDERLARDKLRAYLAGEPDVEIAGEAAGGDEAIAQIRALRPDVLFLDVQMPGPSGFEVLAAVSAQPMAVVFVTAHDGYAVRAFEVEARDYLLKPFDRARFRRALARARASVRPLSRLLVREGDRIRFLPVDDIDWLEAADNYVTVHAGAAEHLLRDTLSGLEARLDAARFVRVHRRAVVNVAAVRAVRAQPHGDHLVELRGGASLPVGRSYRDAFFARMR